VRLERPDKRGIANGEAGKAFDAGWRWSGGHDQESHGGQHGDDEQRPFDANP
jgi:hypothetical protein